MNSSVKKDGVKTVISNRLEIDVHAHTHEYYINILKDLKMYTH